VPLDLDAKIERYLPDGGAGRTRSGAPSDGAALADAHFGLPPFKEYWRRRRNKQYTLTKIFAEPLEYEPGTKEVYSDLGYFDGGDYRAV